GGTVRPGPDVTTPGQLTATGNVTFAPGSNFVSTVVPDNSNPACPAYAPGVNYGQIVSQGTVTIQGGTLTLNFDRSAVGQVFQLISGPAGTSTGFSSVVLAGGAVNLTPGTPQDFKMPVSQEQLRLDYTNVNGVVLTHRNTAPTFAKVELDK